MRLIYQFGTDFSAPAERGTRTAAGGFAPDGRQLFQHRLSGGHELHKRVRPFRAAAFFSTGPAGYLNRARGSPYPGGSLFR